MAWPQATDYNEALQSPAACFRDADLQQSEAATDALGLPRPRSGNFADVYQLHDAGSGQTWAVKCFTRPVPGLRDRYRAVSGHLRQAQLPFMVEFHYLEEGVRVRGDWFPILKMRWVEGLTLNEFLRAHADRPAVLEQLSVMWLKLAQQLRRAGMAHGDLQHGNVLLVEGTKAASLKLRLIDYDGLYVPSLAAQKSGELGHPNYQHPQRLREGTYDAELDRFSHLVIFTALRCLTVGGAALWEKYDNGENLLFREQDFQDPEQSALCRELWQLDDGAARALVGRLVLAARGDLAAVPLLDDVWADGAAVPLTPAQRTYLDGLLVPPREEDINFDDLKLADDAPIPLSNAPVLAADDDVPWWQASPVVATPARPAPVPDSDPALYSVEQETEPDPKPTAAPRPPGSVLPSWGGPVPLMRYHNFWLPRRSRTAAQYRQASAADVENGRFAMAGGLGEGRWVALWARLLATGFARQNVSPLGRCADWIEPLQRRWVSEVKANQSSGAFTSVLQQGVFASFLGLAVYRTGARDQKRWQAVVSGDCGFLLVRDRQLAALFPQRPAAEVGQAVGWLGSRTVLDKSLENAYLRGSGKWQSEDRLIVTSGALLAWFQRQIEAGQKPWDQLERLSAVSDPQNAFAAWIDWLREYADLADDDVTLVTVRL